MANGDEEKPDNTSGGATSGGGTSGSGSASSGSNNSGGNTGSGSSDAPVSTSGSNTTDTVTAASGDTQTSSNTGGSAANSEEQKRELPAEAKQAAQDVPQPEALTPQQILERELINANATEEQKAHARAGAGSLTVGSTDIQQIKEAINQTIANVTGNHEVHQQQQQAPLTPEERAREQARAALSGGLLSSLIGGMQDHNIAAVEGGVAMAQAKNQAIEPAVSGGRGGPGGH